MDAIFEFPANVEKISGSLQIVICKLPLSDNSCYLGSCDYSLTNFFTAFPFAVVSVIK
jgi:hypothetical protein